MNSREFLKILGLKPHHKTVSIIGAGGKTTLMNRIAHAILNIGKTVAITTTTKIFIPAENRFPILLTKKHEISKDLVARFTAQERAAIIGSEITHDKIIGIDSDAVTKLENMFDHIIIECDGAAQKSIKGPAEWEPVIPGNTDIVFVIIGLDCLDRPIQEGTVFRLDYFLKITETSLNARISLDTIFTLLKHPMGALKGTQHVKDKRLILNKFDLLTQDQKRSLLGALRTKGVAGLSSILVGSLKESDSPLFRFDSVIPD